MVNPSGTVGSTLPMDSACTAAGVLCHSTDGAAMPHTSPPGGPSSDCRHDLPGLCPREKDYRSESRSRDWDAYRGVIPREWTVPQKGVS
jgi:hypothetical protein